MIFVLLFVAAFLSKVKPEEMQNYETAIHFQYLVAPCFAEIMFVAVYYLRHGPLRQAVASQIIDIYMNFKELVVQYMHSLAPGMR